MCDRCLDEAGVMKLLKLQSGKPDAITRATERLRCYYECVTRGKDIFEDEPEDPEDWDWDPEY